MIPVYSRNRAYAIFFIAYTLIGESGRVCRGHWGKLLGVFPNPVASPLCDLCSFHSVTTGDLSSVPARQARWRPSVHEGLGPLPGSLSRLAADGLGPCRPSGPQMLLLLQTLPPARMVLDDRLVPADRGLSSPKGACF